MSDLRAAVNAHIFDLPIGNDVTYSRGYSAGIAAARESLRELIPEGAVLVTEETLAAALRDLDTGGDGLEYAHTWVVDSYEQFAAAILARLRETP